MNQQFGNRHHHKGYLLKSNAEYSFALLLDRLMEAEGDGRVIDWLYEPKSFVFDDIKFGTRQYRPDFWVKYKDEEIYCEVKRGHIIQKDVTKYKRMFNNYPEIKLVLVFQGKTAGKGKWAIRLRILLSSARKYVHHVWQVGEDYKRLGIPTKF